MNKSLLIVGAGGHGRVVADAAEATGLWNKIAFIDDEFPGLTKSGVWPVVGEFSDLKSLQSSWDAVVIAVGDNRVRLDLLNNIKIFNFELPVIIHPSAQISPQVDIGRASVVFSNAVINSGSFLGEACIINTAATIDHDNKISDGVHLSPGVHLAGTVVVGECSWLGIGSVVINNINISSDVIVGAGAVVIHDVENGSRVVGVPAKKISND